MIYARRDFYLELTLSCGVHTRIIYLKKANTGKLGPRLLLVVS